MPSTSRNSATDCGYEMHHTRSIGPAEHQELPPGREAPAREAEVAGTDQRDQEHAERQRRRHRHPAEVPLRLTPPRRTDVDDHRDRADPQHRGRDRPRRPAGPAPGPAARLGVLDGPRAAVRSVLVGRASVHDSVGPRRQRAMPTGPRVGKGFRAREWSLSRDAWRTSPAHAARRPGRVLVVGVAGVAVEAVVGVGVADDVGGDRRPAERAAQLLDARRPGCPCRGRRRDRATASAATPPRR